MTERYINSNFLNNRLDFNQKYSKEDFHLWLYSYLKRIKFHHVLDVGCGTGKQTLWFAKYLKKRGRVCALDISEKSVKLVKNSAKGLRNVEVCSGSMDELAMVAKNNFSVSEFDLAHCSFALYYANRPFGVLNQMLKVLSRDGSIAISGPHKINSLFSFLSQYQKIEQSIWDCLEFMNDVVLHFCNRHFKKIETHLFVNNLFVTDITDFAQYYRSSTFFNKQAQRRILRRVSDTIKQKGFFHIQKHSKLIVAKEKRISSSIC